MKNIFSKLAVAAVVGTGLTLGSCADELDLVNPNGFDASSFWVDQSLYEGNPIALANFFRSQTPNITFWAGELRSGSLSLNLINGSGVVNAEYIENLYDEAHTQYTVFGGYYGMVALLNQLIYQCNTQEGVITDNVKEGLLGLAKGWRAFCYFQMYKMYGGVPLRTEPDVILGVTNPTQLYMARATAEETLDFIKKDVQESIDHFANSTWVPAASTPEYYWNKYASQMLKGEVYLWSAKVATGDHTTANAAADVATAKNAFLEIVNSGNYEMVKDYFSIWTTPHNKESIFATCYSNTSDGQVFSSYAAQMMWSKSAGAGTIAWSRQDPSGLALNTDGSVSLFGETYDTVTKKSTQYACWNQLSPSPNRYMYKNALYYQYDDKDLRKAMFFPQWYLTDEEETLRSNSALKPYISGEDFDPTKRDLFGTFFYKFHVSIPAGYSGYSWWNDMPIYRYTMVIAYLAEVANYEGNNADVVKYINMIRERAYGENWNLATYGYTAGSFAENENAIMREKDKEFVGEGQRWWDLRRLTTVKGGNQTDHFVFQPQGCVGYGLDVVANPWMTEQKAVVQVATPVLTREWEYKLLWPVDLTLIGSDPLIKQNPGYSNDAQ
ncbi:MAG: RagB/SusD family nutrient uptake outer membrane protein [Paramuribaculum sp.]|nr:RagB/SusD family nutrient uptake outer membrane protein [Paramuribaculum sp.]